MAIEGLEKQLSRRKFLAGLGLSTVSALLAREAILANRTPRNSPGVSTGTGASPLDPATINHALLGNVTANQHHAQAHLFTSSDHSDPVQTGSGTLTITAGNTLATSTITYPTAYPVGVTPRVQLTQYTSTAYSPTPGGLWIQIPLIVPDTANISWIIPSVETEFLASTRYRANTFGRGFSTSTLTQIYVNVMVAGPAGSGLRVEYSTDNGTTWLALTAFALVDATGVVLSTRGTIPGSPLPNQDNILLRILGTSGDDLTTAQFGSIGVEIRRDSVGAALTAQSVTRLNFVAAARIPFPSTVNYSAPFMWKAFRP